MVLQNQILHVWTSVMSDIIISHEERFLIPWQELKNWREAEIAIATPHYKLVWVNSQNYHSDPIPRDTSISQGVWEELSKIYDFELKKYARLPSRYPIYIKIFRSLI